MDFDYNVLLSTLISIGIPYHRNIYQYLHKIKSEQKLFICLLKDIDLDFACQRGLCFDSGWTSVMQRIYTIRTEVLLHQRYMYYTNYFFFLLKLKSEKI